jgi:putative peptidoglycan lipid II flippase
MSVPSTTQSSAEAQKSFFAHAKTISLLTLLSRVFGLLREAVSAHFLGAGMASVAFTFAFKMPNLFRKLLGEGALSVAFIPLYAQAVKNESLEEANRFAAASVNLLTLILVGLTVVGELLLMLLLWADKNIPVDRALTIKLTMVMLPYLILVCGTAFLSGILQVHRRFAAPAATPIVLNAIHISVIIVGGYLLHLRHSDPQLVHRQTVLVYWLAGLVLVAGMLQLGMLYPGLRAVGFRVRLGESIWNPKIKRMLQLSGPVALSAAVLQLSVLIDAWLPLQLSQPANHGGMFWFFGHLLRYPVEDGAVARLTWAQFLYQFPLGVFAIALATAIFPSLSADALDRDKEQFKSSLRQGIEATMFEGLAASVGLILIRYPLIRLLFQHGNFTAHDTELVAQSVLLYATAIWAFSLQQIISRAYYAMHDTRTPLVMSIVTIVVNTIVEIPLLWPLGEAGMAAGTTVSFCLQAVVMLFMLDGKVDGLDLSKTTPQLFKMVIATMLMTAACIAIQYIPGFPHAVTRLSSLGQLVGITAVGAGVYLGTCYLMGIHILRQLRPRRH